MAEHLAPGTQPSSGMGAWHSPHLGLCIYGVRGLSGSLSRKQPLRHMWPQSGMWPPSVLLHGISHINIFFVKFSPYCPPSWPPCHLTDFPPAQGIEPIVSHMTDKAFLPIMHLCHVGVCTQSAGTQRGWKRGTKSPGAGFIGSCEAPTVDARNQTSGLYKSSHQPYPGALSPTPFLYLDINLIEFPR